MASSQPNSSPIMTTTSSSAPQLTPASTSPTFSTTSAAISSQSAAPTPSSLNAPPPHPSQNDLPTSSPPQPTAHAQIITSSEAVNQVLSAPQKIVQVTSVVTVKSSAANLASSQNAFITSLGPVPSLTPSSGGYGESNANQAKGTLPPALLYTIIGAIVCVVFIAALSFCTCVQSRKRQRSRKFSISIANDEMRSRDSHIVEKVSSFKMDVSPDLTRYAGYELDMNSQPRFNAKLFSPYESPLWGSGGREIHGNSQEYDEKVIPLPNYAEHDFGPLLSTRPSPTQFDNYKPDTIVCLNDPRGLGGSEGDPMLCFIRPNLNNLCPTSPGSNFEGTIPDRLSSLPIALLTGNLARCKPSIRPNLSPLHSPSFNKLSVKPLLSRGNSTTNPVEASKQLQEIINQIELKMVEGSETESSVSSLLDGPLSSEA